MLRKIRFFFFRLRRRLQLAVATFRTTTIVEQPANRAELDEVEKLLEGHRAPPSPFDTIEVEVPPSDIDKERREAFHQAAADLLVHPPDDVDTYLARMIQPISQDLKDVFNRYGAQGWPFVAATMELVAESVKASLDDAGLRLCADLRKIASVTIVQAERHRVGSVAKQDAAAPSEK